MKHPKSNPKNLTLVKQVKTLTLKNQMKKTPAMRRTPRFQRSKPRRSQRKRNKKRSLQSKNYLLLIILTKS